MQFLQENEAIINIKENYISLDNREYEIEMKDHIIDENETIIYKKSKIFSAKETISKEDKWIRKIRYKNPEIIQIRGVKHENELIKDFHPKFKEYQVPQQLKESVKEHLDELERLNIIERIDVKYASPVFPIKKKNNKIRLVIDYCELNQCTKLIEIAFPTINEILTSLNGSKIFSSIDLNNGYYQISMEERY
ncbi:Retrovirus-related Pol polyprotein from transposon opus [Dictyocoela muelleri]|nr:Retrovirus-related Pol polyprotein from transposon opus [Dictyocoela muelleri]